MDHNVINLSTMEQTSLLQPVMAGGVSGGSWELMGLGWDGERGQPGIWEWLGSSGTPGLGV